VTTTGHVSPEIELALAVTARCRIDDLRIAERETLTCLSERHPAVAKFVELRSVDSGGQEHMHGPTFALPAYTLHAGRYRGITCPDRAHAAVWLVIVGTHRSGHRSDPYRIALSLNDRGILMPNQHDYKQLFERRNELAIPLIIGRLSATLMEARVRPNSEQSVLLPGGLTISLCVTVESLTSDHVQLEAIWLAMNPKGLQPGWLEVILATLTLDGTEDRPWLQTAEFPGRERDRRQLRFRFWHETAER